MGWDFRWVSSFGSSFNYDFHATIDPAVAPVEYNYRDQAQLEADNVAWRDWSGEQPGMSAFAREGDDVFHTYSAYARGFDALWPMWQWLDRAPQGRNEGDLSWFHRHDEYPATAAERRDSRARRGVPVEEWLMPFISPRVPRSSASAPCSVRIDEPTKRKESAMNTPPIVSPEEWEAARQQLLVKEKEVTHARDALAAERRRMPWVAVEKEYGFDGPDGTASLLDLFDGRRS